MASFTIIYRFMWELLKLDGYAKQIYATIFGFWIRSSSPVHVPYSALRNITGATAPTISECLKRLVKEKLIAVDPSPGRRTKYTILITEEIFAAYIKDSGVETTKTAKDLNQVNNTTKVLPNSSKPAEPHNESKRICTNSKKNSNSISNIAIPSISSYTVDPRINTLNKQKTS